MNLFAILLVALLPLRVLSKVEEQRCYYGAGQLGPAEFIPCYTGIGTKTSSCCKRGNKCMEGGTCWDRDTGVTYMYGCTDENYEDKSCPRKCGLNYLRSNWVGLVYCRQGWVCHHPDNCGKDCRTHWPWNPTLERPPRVTCEELDTSKVGLKAGSPLQDIMFLPSDDRTVASYLSAHPTSTASKASSAAVTTSSVTESAPSSTPIDETSSPDETSSSDETPSPAPTTSSGTTDSPSSMGETATYETSTSAPPGQRSKTGMAVGIGVAVPMGLAMAGALIFFFLRRRRSGASTGAEETSQEKSEWSPGGAPGVQTYPESTYDPGNSPDPGYSFKAELAADERPPPTELEGSTIDERSPVQSPLSQSFMSPVRSEFSGNSQRYSHMGSERYSHIGSERYSNVGSEMDPNEHRVQDRSGTQSPHPESLTPGRAQHQIPNSPGDTIYEMPG